MRCSIYKPKPLFGSNSPNPKKGAPLPNKLRRGSLPRLWLLRLELKKPARTETKKPTPPDKDQNTFLASRTQPATTRPNKAPLGFHRLPTGFHRFPKFPKFPKFPPTHQTQHPARKGFHQGNTLDKLLYIGAASVLRLSWVFLHQMPIEVMHAVGKSLGTATLFGLCKTATMLLYHPFAPIPGARNRFGLARH